MRRDLDRLANESFDILVVGGGIHGVCVARDAALRGLKVALVERDDFGAATSHNSLKIIHGGFRYLQHLDLRRLRQSVEERRYWLRTAPHLVRPLQFVMPLYGQIKRGPAAMCVATALYTALAWDRDRGVVGNRRIPAGSVVSRAECEAMIPGIDTVGLSGGVCWYDGQVQDADRLLLECLSHAAANGAVVANYVAASGFLRTGEGIAGIQASDAIDGTTFDIRARLTVNACGPWADRLLADDLGLRRDGGTALSKSMNLVTRAVSGDFAFGARSSRASDAVLGRGRRMFFFTPWKGRTVIGTGHLPYRGRPEDCRFEEVDVTSFLDEINDAYPGAQLRLEDVQYVYGGLTPAENDDNARDQVARARQSALVDHRRTHGLEGLLSVIGVKWTTARLMAEKVMDLAADRLGRTGLPCVTATTPIPSSGAHEQCFETRCISAVRDGLAIRLSDLVFRRLDASHRAELDAAQLAWCAGMMARELGWTPARQAAELESVRRDRWWRIPDAPAAGGMQGPLADEYAMSLKEIGT